MLAAERPGPAATLAAYSGFVWRRATSRQRPLPDYLVIGAQKSATTSLHEYLVSHPDVVAPLEKEVHFFSGDVFDRGAAWYRAHFPTRRARDVIERRTVRRSPARRRPRTCRHASRPAASPRPSPTRS
jgi:hypothetical protein